MSMPKEWTDKIKAQEQQEKLEADNIHNLLKEFEHQQQQQQRKQQKDTDKEPMLNVGEKILWKNVIKRGFWHRHVEWILEITTQGIVMEHGVKGRITRLPYYELYDVVVTNQHSTGTGYHYTMRTGTYHSPMANYWSMNQWTGQQIGDMIFLDKNGNARMTWNDMISPHGIQQLAKAEMKRFHRRDYSSTNTPIDKCDLFKVGLLDYEYDLCGASVIVYCPLSSLILVSILFFSFRAHSDIPLDHYLRRLSLPRAPKNLAARVISRSIRLGAS